MDSTVEYDFTIFTSHASSGSQKQSAATLFSAKEFKRPSSDDLASHLVSRIDEAEAVEQSLVSIVRLHNYTPAVITILENAIPGFPQGLLQNVVYDTSTGQNISMIPRARKDSLDIRFLINYPLALPYEPATIGFLPGGVWICPSSVVSGSAGRKPTIFLICQDKDVPGILASYFSDIQYTRWARLQKQPLWIFADLLHIFGDWSQIWNITKQNITVYHHEIHAYPLTRPLLDLIRGLHEEAAKILSVREQLRVHASALTRFLHLKEVKRAHGLTERVQENLDDINYHEETSQVILRQLENMMSLAFNIETMTQGQAVARLNVLAFAFIPLSWVASIFGMTQFSISAAWYPMGAFVALLTIILVSFALPVRGIYGYVLGLSTSRSLHRNTLGSAPKIKENDSLSTHSNVIRADTAAGLPRRWYAGADRLNISKPKAQVRISPPFIVNRIGGAVQPCPPAALRRVSSPDPSPGQHATRSRRKILQYKSMNSSTTAGTCPSTQPAGYGGPPKAFEMDTSQQSDPNNSMKTPPFKREKDKNERSSDLEAQRSTF